MGWRNKLRITKLVILNPLQTIRALISIIYELACLPYRRLLAKPRPQTSLRTALFAAFYGSVFGYHPHVVYRADPDSVKKVTIIEQGDVNGFIIPKNADLSKADMVMIFAHGGGYAFGEPLMYIRCYERWVKRAQEAGFNLVILTVKYPLSRFRKWPACLEAFDAAYDYVLTKVPASKVVFCGDSAGGGLCGQALFSQKVRNKPHPWGSILISPFADLTCEIAANSELMCQDWLMTFPTDGPKLAELLCPPGMDPSDPRVSPVLQEDFTGLGNVLVFAGTSEILLEDSKRWVQKAKKAGDADIVMFHEGVGEVHTYPIGKPVVSSERVERECDDLIMDFLLKAIDS